MIIDVNIKIESDISTCFIISKRIEIIEKQMYKCM